MRPLAALLAISALVVAGCGGDSGGGSSGSLDEALGYLAEDSPLVITIDTDVEGEQFKALEGIVEKFPFGGELRGQLLDGLGLGEGDFEEDVKPILGNEFVVGATSVASIVDSSEDDDFVGAIEAKDRDALENAVEKEGARQTEEAGGATIYEDREGDAFAIEDDVLVVAGSRELLDQALEQRDGDGRLTEERFQEGLADLPEDALVKVYGDIGALIEGDPTTGDARKIEWVGALDTFGLTAAVQEDEVAIDFNLTTEGEDLGDEDLPLATGSESPGIVQKEDEVGVGVRDVNHIFEFGQTAAQAVDPAAFADFERAKKQISDQLGVSIDDDVFGQLTGDASIAIPFNGDFGARAELKDPAAAREALEKAAPVIPDAAGSAFTTPPRLTRPDGSDGLYRLQAPQEQPIFFGVLNDVFVIASDAQRAEQLAEAEPEAVEGAEGALSFRVNAEEFADSVLSGLGGLEGIGGRLFTGPLGDLSGSVESSSGGLRGSLTLGID